MFPRQFTTIGWRVISSFINGINRHATQNSPCPREGFHLVQWVLSLSSPKQTLTKTFFLHLLQNTSDHCCYFSFHRCHEGMRAALGRLWSLFVHHDHHSEVPATVCGLLVQFVIGLIRGGAFPEDRGQKKHCIELNLFVLFVCLFPVMWCCILITVWVCFFFAKQWPVLNVCRILGPH